MFVPPSNILVATRSAASDCMGLVTWVDRHADRTNTHMSTLKADEQQRQPHGLTGVRKPQEPRRGEGQRGRVHHSGTEQNRAGG